MNQLADSLSPYLLQHQDNPVDWYPWCQDAFDKARETDRPIFLSVGYAACHWCHVMEHESFENPQIAALLNEHFVSIKVDREERPDIDQIYMNAVQVMTGRGGWPMSVFLDHDRQPFYAGTYWPPQQKFGMPGFTQVLDALIDAWQHRRQEVQQHAGEMTAALQQLAIGTTPDAKGVPPDSLIDTATERLLATLDRVHGGFGGAPKFPHVTDLNLMLVRGTAQQQSALIEAVELTLDRMAAGGIRDHVGGGFARYSVDARWLVPHFEKMLYDNALLAQVYCRAYQVTGHQRHGEVAGEILDYLCRDMVDAAGGFHCSEDADSEGVEGKFYVWTPQEIVEVLGPQRGNRFCQIYDITSAGNFEGKNIPNLPRSIEAWADQLSISSQQLAAELSADRDRLYQARQDRVRPGRDDKVLTAWNALAIEALAICGGVLNRPEYLVAAERAAEFILGEMSTADHRLLHAYRDGQAHLAGYVDDYAYTVNALVALFQATGQSRWIERAAAYAEVMLDRFYDQDQGGFYYTADDAEVLIARTKDWHDGSLVSGNAAAVTALLQLWQLCDRDAFRQAAEQTLARATDVIERQAAACAGLLAGLDRFWHGREQLVVAVENQAERAVIGEHVLRKFRPRSTLSWVVGESDDAAGVISLNHERKAIDGQLTVYRCQDFSCDLPLSGAAAVQWLAE